MVAQERGRYFLGACTKCKGDIVLDTKEEPYCFQCGKVFYDKDKIEYKKERQIPGRISDSHAKDEIYLDKRQDIVNMLERGDGPAFIADFLNISIRRVSEVKEVLKFQDED